MLLCICAYVHAGQCVCIERNVSRWRPPITKESATSPFSFMQPVPTLLLLLWQPALSPWALHASNQSETFVEIPQGSTYSTYPTGTAFTLKRLEQREERLPHHSLVWHQKLGLQGQVTGNAEELRSQKLKGVRQKQKQGGSALPWPISVEIMWNRICYWKPQSLNTWQASHGSGTGLSLISQNGFRLSLFMSFLKTYG